jgi:hypothetical protein
MNGGEREHDSIFRRLEEKKMEAIMYLRANNSRFGTIDDSHSSCVRFNHCEWLRVVVFCYCCLNTLKRIGLLRKSKMRCGFFGLRKKIPKKLL